MLPSVGSESGELGGIKDILTNLATGLPVLKGIVLGEPPIQENSPEIEQNE